MVRAFLDALEITYVLYGADDELRPMRLRPPLSLVPRTRHSATAGLPPHA